MWSLVILVRHRLRETLSSIDNGASHSFTRSNLTRSSASGRKTASQDRKRLGQDSWC